jgi:transcriptional regulator with XRE-family HTH domain
MEKAKILNRKVRQLGIMAVAEQAGLNKSTISRYVHGQRDYSLENFEKVTTAVEIIEKKKLRGLTSARQASERVVAGENWQIAYFDFVDSFLFAKNYLLVSQRPVDGLDLKSLALICSIVMQLCEENRVQFPEWAKINLELDEPWFISKFKSLRA